MAKLSKFSRLFLGALLLATACVAQQMSPTAPAAPVQIPQATTPPLLTATPIGLAVAVTLTSTATATLKPTPTATQTDWLNTATVEGDLYILGNPNAPLRLIDFSDFL